MKDFDAVIMPLRGKVFAQAMNLCRNRDDAEDLTQQTMIKASRSWHRFNESFSPWAWLSNICRTIHIDNFRTTRRDPGFVPIGEIDIPFPETPESIYLTSERFREAAEIAKSLSPLRREAMAFWAIHQCEADVAREMEIEYQAAHNLVQRAKRQIHQRMAA